LEYGKQGDDKQPSKELFHEITNKIKERKFAELFATDQLLRERTAGNAFMGFSEGVYNFPPTFKVVKGSLTDYNEERSPAYCDRILWKSFPGRVASQLTFGSAPPIVTSDHKPVFGSFRVTPFVLPGGCDSERGPAVLHISKLKAKNLPAADRGKTSDPYVKFKGSFFAHTIKTPYISKNLNPEWKDSDVPHMPLTTNSLARMRKHFVMIIVWDHDTATKDDILANGVLHLSDVLPATVAANANTASGAFTIQLTRGGVPAGTLEGVATIQWAAPTTKLLSVQELGKLGLHL